MYIHRTLETVAKDISNYFKILLITGPRQVGKTTMLRKITTNDRTYISFDNLETRIKAQEDPKTFIKNLKLPVLIDEVQYVPEIFSYIKLRVDSLEENGLFWLTSSQQFSMMKNVSESLAGRVVILDLLGISQSEEQAREDQKPFIPTNEFLQERANYVKEIDEDSIYKRIFRGSYPKRVIQEEKYIERFYDSYVKTYIESDVREYMQIENISAFKKFLTIAASRTGRLINYRDISNNVDVSEPTIKSWIKVLEATGIVFLLYPYFNNISKRTIKKPKLYFLDTGLCSYLGKWGNPETLENGALSGQIFETFVVTEILKSYLHNGKTPKMYFYRDKNNNEVDLIIEEDGKIYPIEIKKTASISNTKFKGFDFLNSLNMPISEGAVICTNDMLLPFNENISIVPVNYI